MKKLLTFILTLLLISGWGQKVAITIDLKNLLDSKNIKEAEINLCGQKSVSDSAGRTTIFTKKGVLCIIKIKHPDFKDFSEKIFAIGDTSLTFSLEPNIISLDEITVQAEKDNTFGISRLNNIEGTTIFAGKKSEAIYVQDLNANLASNNSRQIFAKVPGINIFENDGSGSTIGIGGRGLNPNRISNFNTRQNGYDISADALGYPESYYTPPTEAIDRIEILRGAAALQFGSQFGGMINYKFAEPVVNKKLSGNFRQTIGSFGFFNSFNQLSGTNKKLSYNVFYQLKKYDGWRMRSQLNSHNVFGSLRYAVNSRLSFKVEYTFLNFLSQQPGGLTDRQFATDASLVIRQRNWFQVRWNLAALISDYKLSDRTSINIRSFFLNAGRDALGVLGRTERLDDTTANRNLLSDKYNNFGVEMRVLHRYSLFKNNNHVLFGARYYNGKTDRKQGDSDKSNEPNFKFLRPDNLENSAYLFPSQNMAVFIENIFQFTTRLNITPGIRMEHIRTSSQGYYRLLNRNLAGDTLLDLKVEDSRLSSRSFVLLGIGTQFKLNKLVELYGNFSQNYRSINFNDMRVVNPNFEVDPNLKDENGFTADGGIRGAIKNLLYFDVSVFLLKYNDRIGTALKVDSSTFQLIRYRTNIGQSKNIGLEIFTEIDWAKFANKGSKHKVSTFINFAWTKATYQSPILAYNNKKVEYVPEIIFRTGLTYGYKKISMTYQYSYTGEQFSDASNALYAPSAIYGLIPRYSIMDFSVNYNWKFLGIGAGVNNLTNEKYFTRRAEGYPGPGIIPADPLNFYCTLKLKF